MLPDSITVYGARAASFKHGALLAEFNDKSVTKNHHEEEPSRRTDIETSRDITHTHSMYQAHSRHILSVLSGFRQHNQTSVIAFFFSFSLSDEFWWRLRQTPIYNLKKKRLSKSFYCQRRSSGKRKRENLRCRLFKPQVKKKYRWQHSSVASSRASLSFVSRQSGN